MISNDKPSDLVQIQGFAPDADPNTPGTLSDCVLMIPNHRGFQTPRVPRTATFDIGAPAGIADPVVDAVVVGANTGQGPFGEHYLASYDGTTMRIYELRNNTTAEATSGAGLVSWLRAGFAVFGGSILVCDAGALTNSKLQTKLVNHPGVLFAEIATAPSCRFLVVAERFVIGFNGTPSGGGLGQEDYWFCCARDNHLLWTPDPATLATQGRLPDRFGAITGAVVLGSRIYAFKSRTCYVGTFVGAPEVWEFAAWSYQIGAITAPRTYRSSIIFLASDNLYRFDGATMTPLMDGSMAKYYSEFVVPGSDSEDTCDLRIDDAHDLAYVTVRSNGPITAGTKDYVFVCHIPTRRWGRADLPDIRFYYEAPNGFSANHYSRFNDGPWSLYAVGTDNRTRPVIGDFVQADAPDIPSITLNDFGDAFNNSDVTGIAVKTLRSDGDSRAYPFYRVNLDDDLIAGTVKERVTDGMYEIRQSARWHRVRIEFDDAVEITGYRVSTDDDGSAA